MLLLLVTPAGGDELQGMKKGIVELADLVVVNKADGALAQTARHTQAEYLHAFQLARQKHAGWSPKVLLCSSATETGGINRTGGVHRIWETIDKFFHHMEQTETNNIAGGGKMQNPVPGAPVGVSTSSLLFQLRAEQRKKWLWRQVHSEFTSRLQAQQDYIPELKQVIETTYQACEAQLLSPRSGANQILDVFCRHPRSSTD